MDIGSKIQDFRERKNMTQDELAKAICKSKSSIQKYESDQILVPIDVLEDISHALGVNIVNFFTSDVDDILLLITERFNLKDNNKGQLEYDFKLLMEVLKTKYK